MDLETLASGTGSLPSLPAVVLNLLALANEPDAELRDVVATIERDPALTAKILGFANSPMYAKAHKVENLTRAVTVMGLNAVVSLALGFSVTASAGPHHYGGALDYSLYWRRSLTAATAAAELGGVAMGDYLREELFLAGLLQDIGMLAIDRLDPDFYRPLGTDQRHHHKVRDHEHRNLSADHATAGALLLKQWRLADRTIMAVEASHKPQAWPLTHELGRFARSIALSGQVADFLILGGSPPAFEALAERCRHILQLEPQQLESVITRVSAKLPELEVLFDFSAATGELEVAVPAPANGGVIRRKLRKLVDFLALERRENDAIPALERRENDAIPLRDMAKALGPDDERLDPLTGVFSRKFLETYLPDLLHTVRRGERPLSLVFADVSNFSDISRQLGAASERVLAGVARILERHVRAGDVVVRYGNEIFLVVLPGAPPDAAARVCGRIMGACSTLQFPVGKEVVGVDLAMGLATADSSQHFESAEELLAAANLALFKAKVAGKGKLVRFEKGDTHQSGNA